MNPSLVIVRRKCVSYPSLLIHYERLLMYLPIIIQVKSTLPTTSFPLYSGSVYVILTICHSESKLLHHGLPALSIYTCLAFQVLIPHSRCIPNSNQNIIY
uniref:Uncharacterized protein n=1 Tax=Cacopsylla melanoneura TaxID=428564 RepID=A0A8D8QPV1_9HEMI